MLLHENDSGKLSYSALFTGYRIGFPMILRKWQINLGVSGHYGVEKVQLENNNTSFLQNRSDKAFVHQTFLAGPTVELKYKLGSYVFAGLNAARYYDFSINQWSYKGSSQPYGTPGKVSAGFSGYYFGLVLGMSFPIEEYDYSYYD